MEKKKQALIEQAGFSQTFESDRLERLIDLTVDQCVDAIRKTNFDFNTTYDRGQGQGIVEKCITAINRSFDR